MAAALRLYIASAAKPRIAVVAPKPATKPALKFLLSPELAADLPASMVS